MSKIAPFTLDMMTQLIHSPSVSCTLDHIDQGNQGVIHLLANWFEDEGFDVEVQTLPHHPEKKNLIATFGHGNNGLVLSGHTDTVPFNIEKWSSDPFTLTLKDERFYGLGTADMKSFFAIILSAIKALKQEIDFTTIKAPLIIVATADEETTMEGARALQADKIVKASCAIIGEPTNLVPIRAHKGMIMQAIRLEGKAGHSSNPALGKNALDGMTEVLHALQQFRAHLKSTYQNSDFEIDYPTLNLGCIHGGDNPNRICGSCEVQFDIRPLPGMKLAPLKESIFQKIKPIADKHHLTLTLTDLFPGLEAFETPVNNAFVQTVKQLTQAEPQTVAYATEAPFFQNMGLDTLVMGAGSIDQAHQPNEFVEAQQIQEAIEIIKNAIHRTCF